MTITQRELKIMGVKTPNEARDVLAEIIDEEFSAIPEGAENQPHQLLITATINQVLSVIRGIEFPD